MRPEPLSEIESTTPQVRPQQFELREIAWIIAGVGVACAVAAPFFRDVSPEKSFTWLSAIAIQLASFLVAIGWAVIRRRNMLIKAGRCLGQGLSADYGTLRGMASWMSRPIATVMIMLMQVGLALLLFSLIGTYQRWNDYFGHVLIGWTGAATLVSLRFGRHFGAVEFFENGISHIPTAFIPWEQIEVHPDKFQQDVVWLSYFRWKQSVPTSVFKVVVSDDLKQSLLEHYGEVATDSDSMVLSE